MKTLTMKGAAALTAMLAATSMAPAHAVFTPPRVSFNFTTNAPPDTDPSPFITTGQVTVSRGGGGLVYDGWASANMPEGTLRATYSEHYNVPGANVAVDSVGHSSSASMFDTVTALSTGSLTLTLTGHALLDWSHVVIPGPGQTDNSWAGYGFSLSGRVTDASDRGGGQARSVIEVKSDDNTPTVVAEDWGVAGVRLNIDATTTLTATGGVLALRAWMNAGDRFSFAAIAAGRGWADLIQGGFASADLSHTAALSITGSPGMSWASDSGVLLSAVPEPGAWALMLAGLGVVAFVARRRQ